MNAYPPVYHDESYRLAQLAFEMWEMEKSKGRTKSSEPDERFIKRARDLVLLAEYQLALARQESRSEAAYDHRVLFEELLDQELPEPNPDRISRVLGRITTLSGLRKKITEVFSSQTVYDEIWRIVVERDFSPIDYGHLKIHLHPIAAKALEASGEDSSNFKFPYLNRYVSQCLDQCEVAMVGYFPHCVSDLGKIRGAVKIIEEGGVTVNELETLRDACSISEAARKGKSKSKMKG